MRVRLANPSSAAGAPVLDSEMFIFHPLGARAPEAHPECPACPGGRLPRSRTGRLVLRIQWRLHG